MTKGWSNFMDRRVKERLVGASILVVLVVLIVPELFSGPKPAAVPAAVSVAGQSDSHNVIVDMTTSKATPAAEDPAASAAAAADEGAAAAAVQPPGSGADTASIVTLQAQTPAKAPLENSAAPPKSSSSVALKPEASHHNWSVQLGTFASRGNADKLQRTLQADGFTAWVLTGGAGRSTRYRVRVGPAADRAGAQKLIARLRKEGHAGSVVAP